MDQIENFLAPGLPKLIIVDFGTDYIGPTFFPGYSNRSGWLLIHPIASQWYTKPTNIGGNFEEHTRTMLPLRSFWT